MLANFRSKLRPLMETCSAQILIKHQAFVSAGFRGFPPVRSVSFGLFDHLIV